MPQTLEARRPCRPLFTPPPKLVKSGILDIFRSGPIAASKPKPNMRPWLFRTFLGQQNPYKGSGHIL